MLDLAASDPIIKAYERDSNIFGIST